MQRIGTRARFVMIREVFVFMKKRLFGAAALILGLSVFTSALAAPSPKGNATTGTTQQAVTASAAPASSGGADEGTEQSAEDGSGTETQDAGSDGASDDSGTSGTSDVSGMPETADGNTETQEEQTGSGSGTASGGGSDTVYIEDDSLTQPDIQYAQAALLMDMKSGRLLYGKNIDERLYPASLTKMMTGIIALETGNMADVVSASYEAIAPITLEDSQMGILTGEELTMEQLVNGLLIHSANDAANVIAVHLGGSLQAFVDTMNAKAAELGMTNTHFANPCGTHDDNHYTTARDMAILAQYAMQNEAFRNIVKTVTYKIAPTNKYTSERILVNTNLFLSTIRSLQHYYPPCTGIKTGHTSQSGYCLVAAAQYNGTDLLSIVMKCPNTNDNEGAYSYIDARELFDFGFDNYVSQPIAAPGDIVADSKVKEAKNDTRVALTVETNVDALIPSNVDKAAEVITNVNLPEEIYAPVTKGDILGTVTYTYKGTQIGTSNLVATNDVERNEILHFLNLILRIITSPFFFIPVIVIILVLIFAASKKKKRDRQKRIQQLKKKKRTQTDKSSAARAQRLSDDIRSDNSRYTK